MTTDQIGRLLTFGTYAVTLVYVFSRGNLDPTTANTFGIFRALYYALMGAYIYVSKYPDEKWFWAYGTIWMLISITTVFDTIGD